MITVSETDDRDLVKEIMTHEDIWWRIGGEDPDDFYPPADCIYLLARIDDVPAGLLVLLPDFDSHFQLLPQFRDQKYAVGAAILAKAKEYTGRITTEIGKEHANVHHFALKNGYTVLKEDKDNWYYEKVL
jgi:hypothetical protein